MASTVYLAGVTSQTDGTAATTANTGLSLINAAGSVTWSSALARFGRNGIRCEVVGTGTSVARAPFQSADKTQAITYTNVLMPGTVTADMTILRLRSSTGRVADIQWSSTGQLKFRPLTGSQTTFAAAGVMTPGGKYDAAITAAAGTSTTDGKFSVDFTAPGSSTVVATLTLTNTDMGTANLTDWEIGGNGVAGVTGVTVVETETGRTTKIAPYSLPNSAPSVSLPASQNVTAGSTITMAITASDVEGSISSYATTVTRYSAAAAPAAVTVTNASTANPSWTAGSAGSVDVVSVTVTDNGGLSSTATTEYRVDAAAGTAVAPLWKDRETAVGTWTRVGSAATDGAALADSLDSTYLESGAISGTEQSIDLRFTPRGTLASGVLTVRMGTDSGSATATVRLVEGNTVRESWTQAVNATPTDYTFTLSSATISAIADPRNLRCRAAISS